MALVQFAARKAGVTCSFQHSTRINGIWETLGGEVPVVVTITPVPNVVRIGAKGDA